MLIASAMFSVAMMLLPVVAETETITALVYCDNQFDFYVNGVLVKSDPLDFRPHNAVKFTFDATKGLARTYAIKATDWVSSGNNGYEYSSTTAPQLGDGGLRVLLSDGTVSNSSWKCFTTNYGPTSASIAAGCSSTNLTPCALKLTAAPTNWTIPSFNDASWTSAGMFSEAVVGWGSAPTYANGKCGMLTDPYTRADMVPSTVTTLADECLSPAAQSWGASSFIWYIYLD